MRQYHVSNKSQNVHQIVMYDVSLQRSPTTETLVTLTTDIFWNAITLNVWFKLAESQKTKKYLTISCFDIIGKLYYTEVEAE